MTRRQIYWTCQIGGWSAMMGLGILSQSILEEVNWPECFLFLALGAIGVLSTHIFRLWVRRNGWLKLPIRPLLLRILAGIVTLAGCMTLVGLPMALLAEDPKGAAGFGHFAQFLNWSFIFLVWSLIYFGVHWLEDLQRVRIEKWRLEAVLKEAELKALKAQLNPHFLFNSLNNLRGLILEDVERAQAMVTQLAGLLRYALQAGESTTVPVEEELRIVRYYLDLEAVRLEERLGVSWSVDQRAMDASIPPMLLQSLVENAIKHGIAARPRGGEIELDIRRERQRLAIRVRNTGQMPEERSAGGMGIDNAVSRLKLIYGEEASLRLRNDGDSVLAELDLPYRESAP